MCYFSLPLAGMSLDCPLRSFDILLILPFLVYKVVVILDWHDAVIVGRQNEMRKGVHKNLAYKRIYLIDTRFRHRAGLFSTAGYTFGWRANARWVFWQDPGWRSLMLQFSFNRAYSSLLCSYLHRKWRREHINRLFSATTVRREEAHLFIGFITSACIAVHITQGCFDSSLRRLSDNSPRHSHRAKNSVDCFSCLSGFRLAWVVLCICFTWCKFQWLRRKKVYIFIVGEYEVSEKSFWCAKTAKS